MTLIPNFKRGDRLPADTVNAIITQLNGQIPTPALIYDGDQHAHRDQPYHGRSVAVVSSVDIPAYSVFCPHLTTPPTFDGSQTFKPRYTIGTHVDGNMPILTNGSVEIKANKTAIAYHMVEGEYHWVRATGLHTGHCGIKTVAAGLENNMQGFFSCGGRTVTGTGSLIYVTRMRNGVWVGESRTAIPTSGTGTVEVWTNGSSVWGDVPVRTTLARALVTPIDAGKPVALLPVDFMWLALELC